MSDEEDYDSSDDEEYVPTDGEAVSEEENSGDEENLDVLKEDGEPTVSGKRKRKSPKKPAGPRKRTGGIQLTDSPATGTSTDDTNTDAANSELGEQIRLEQEQKKEVQAKKKADDLWANFMSDVGRPAPRKPTTPSGGGLSSLASISKPIPSSAKPSSSAPEPVPAKSTPSPAAPTPSPAAPNPSKITVTKVYDFAGEAVQVTKELDVNSKEGQAELKKQQQQSQDETEEEGAGQAAGTVSGIKRVSGSGLGGVLDKINKKPKIGTLEKSKLDWETFKKKEGIEDELKIHNRGKQSYIERMNFLQRTDMKQFEIEKSLRLTSSSKR